MIFWFGTKKYYKPGDFALKAAGVPCTEYSVAKTTGSAWDLEKADRLVIKTLEIIAFFGQKDGGSRTQGGACSKVEKSWKTYPFWMWTTAIFRGGVTKSPPEFGVVSKKPTKKGGL